MSLMRRLERGQEGEENAEAPNEKEQTMSGEKGEGSRLSSLRARRVSSAAGGKRDSYLELKTRVQNRLLAELDPSLDIGEKAEVRRTIQDLFEQILVEEKIVVPAMDRGEPFVIKNSASPVSKAIHELGHKVLEVVKELESAEIEHA